MAQRNRALGIPLVPLGIAGAAFAIRMSCLAAAGRFIRWRKRQVTADVGNLVEKRFVDFAAIDRALHSRKNTSPEILESMPFVTLKIWLTRYKFQLAQCTIVQRPRAGISGTVNWFPLNIIFDDINAVVNINDRSCYAIALDPDRIVQIHFTSSPFLSSTLWGVISLGLLCPGTVCQTV